MELSSPWDTRVRLASPSSTRPPGLRIPPPAALGSPAFISRENCFSSLSNLSGANPRALPARRVQGTSDLMLVAILFCRKLLPLPESRPPADATLVFSPYGTVVFSPDGSRVTLTRTGVFIGTLVRRLLPSRPNTGGGDRPKRLKSG